MTPVPVLHLSCHLSLDHDQGTQMETKVDLTPKLLQRATKDLVNHGVFFKSIKNYLQRKFNSYTCVNTGKNGHLFLLNSCPSLSGLYLLAQ